MSDQIQIPNFDDRLNKLQQFLQTNKLPFETTKGDQTGLFITEAVTIADLTSFFAQTMDDLGLMDFIPQDEDLPLKDLPLKSVALGPLDLTSNAQVVNLGFTLTWKNTINISETPIDLQVHNPSIRFEITGQKVNAELSSGQITLNQLDLKFNLRIGLPSLILEADITETDESSNKLLDSFNLVPGGSAAAPGKGIKLAGLKLLVSIRQKNFILHFSIEDMFDFKYLVLRGTQVELSSFGGLSQLSGKVWLDVLIPLPSPSPSLGVNLVAEMSDSGKAWSFSGSVDSDEMLQVGPLTDSLASLFDLNVPTLPGFIRDSKIEILSLKYDTGAQASEFDFICGINFPVEGHDLDLTVHLNAQEESTNKMLEASGDLKIGELEFEVDFKQTSDKKQKMDMLIASFTESGAQNLKSLVGDISSNDALLAIIPDLTVQIQDILFAYLKQDSSSPYLFGVALDAGMAFNLNHLPVAGSLLGGGKFGIEDLRFFIASQPFSSEQISLLPEDQADIIYLPPPNGEQSSSEPVNVLHQGPNFRANLNLGTGSASSIPQPSGSDPQTPQSSDSASPAPPASNAQGAWVNVNKTFGPLTVDKIGVDYKDQRLWFLFTSEITAGGLTLGLDGLGIGSRLDEFSPAFMLSGMSVTFNSSAFEISGGLVAQNDFQSLLGEVLIKAGDTSLSAFGEYQDTGGFKSMFIFAMLDRPLGGPSAFFVTGLAAGFGYHSKLNIPPVSSLRDYPLVKGAIQPAGSGRFAGKKNDPGAVLQILQDSNPPAVEPDPNEYWLGLGVRFTSFEMIHSFALVTASFGVQDEIALLGRSTISVPTGEPDPIAFAEVDLVAIIQPEATGQAPVLAINGALAPGSYVFSQACRLTGGFAYYLWSSGEFVITYGGYHPNFAHPAYYPEVDRLSISWQVNTHLSLKGQLYFALTPSAIMAGGGLQAVYQTDAVTASFIVQADFLLSWKPFHYEILIQIHLSVDVHLDMGLFTAKPSFHVGVDLALHGPPFGGVATVDLDIISFSIDFGPPPQTPSLLTWQGFTDAFLPKDSNNNPIFQKVSVTDGLVKELSDFGWIINPQHFELTSHLTVPATKAKIDEQDISVTSDPLGILPMGKQEFSSVHTIQLEKRDEDGTMQVYDPDERFVIAPVYGKSPKALYSNAGLQSNNERLAKETMIENTLLGLKLSSVSTHPDQTQEVPIQTLLFTTAEIKSYKDFLGMPDDIISKPTMITHKPAPPLSDEARKAQQDLLRNFFQENQGEVKMKE